MSELRKANTDHPYFLTLSIAGWIDVFTRNRYNEIISSGRQEKRAIAVLQVRQPFHQVEGEDGVQVARKNLEQKS